MVGGGKCGFEASLFFLRNLNVFSEMGLEMLHDFIPDCLELYMDVSENSGTPKTPQNYHF